MQDGQSEAGCIPLQSFSVRCSNNELRPLKYVQPGRVKGYTLRRPNSPVELFKWRLMACFLQGEVGSRFLLFNHDCLKLGDLILDPSIYISIDSKSIFRTKSPTKNLLSAAMAAKQVRIGVFIPSGAQALDVATVDVLAVMSKEYLGILPMLPAHMAELAPSVTISYITTPEQGPEIPLTANMTIKATHSYEEPEVAPGQLDIVIIPGPDPFDPLEEGGLKWLRAQFETPGVDILSVCTGLYICGAAGILKGKTASGPRGLQDDLIKKFPGVKLVGEKYRWVQDGNLWSSGELSAPLDSAIFHCHNSAGTNTKYRWYHQRQRPHGSIRKSLWAVGPASRRVRTGTDGCWRSRTNLRREPEPSFARHCVDTHQGMVCQLWVVVS